MEPRSMRTVLHVLPHPGGGGETYVESLTAIQGYRFERVHLADGRPGRAVVAALPGPIRRLVGRVALVHVHGEAAAGLCLPLAALRPGLVTLHGLNLLRRATGGTQTAAIVNLR